MRRMRKSVFFSLSIRMVGFGLGVGIFFPFFSVLFGVDMAIAYSFIFITACVFAGILVGIINYILVKKTVGEKLTLLIEKMLNVRENVLSQDFSQPASVCAAGECLIQEDSEDEFGTYADSFNIMVKSLIKMLKFQSHHRTFVEQLSANLDLNALSSLALKMLMKYSGSVAGAIFIEKEGELENISQFGIKDAKDLSKNMMLLDLLKTSESMVVDFPEDIKLDGLLTEYRPAQVVFEPILFLNSTVGAVVLASTKEMDKDFLDQIDIFVHNFSLLLNNSQQHEQIQKLAALDSLTGVYNRRFGETRLSEEFDRSVRTGSALGVMMLDIDKFKVVNDTYGHIAGDKFLKHIVKICAPVLRNGDFTIRYGGEEFLLVLPGASRSDVFKIAERVRFAIAQSSIIYGESTISATVSIGVDSMPESSIENPTALIKNADTALYAAKHSGRNKTIMFDGDKK
jgi:two-component system, cell cycle response regulator